jgi:hypothetical protein
LFLSVVIVETGIGIDGETVGAEVTIGSGVTAAVVGIDDTVVSHEVKTGVVRIVCTIGVLHFSLGIIFC